MRLAWTDAANLTPTLTVAVNRLQSHMVSHYESSGSSGKDDDTGHTPPVKPAGVTDKLQFPHYDGTEDRLPWLQKCNQLFRTNRSDEGEKVWIASFYLDGAAQQWYYRLEHNRGVPTWAQFEAGINRCFDPPIRSNPFGEKTQLRRTGSVTEYQESFLSLLSCCDNVTES